MVDLYWQNATPNNLIRIGWSAASTPVQELPAPNDGAGAAAVV
jgi:hypothetical protein